MIDALGTNSCSIPSNLATNWTTEKTTPVILPPGRLMLATRPTLTGSAPMTNTIGVVAVVALPACAAGTPAPDPDRGDLPAHEIGRQSRQPIQLIVRPAILDGDVLAFDEFSVIQTLPKGIDNICEAGSRGASEKSDNRHRRLLRARHERPRGRRAAEQRDELAPLSFDHLVGGGDERGRHGEAKHPGGLVIDRRARTSTTVTTGRSAGLVPLRMRST